MIFAKTEQEIDLMREPCRIMRDALDYLGNQLKAGMTTADVNALADDYIRSRGAIPSCLGYCGYPASVCVSVNEQVVHGIPGERIIRDGDIVSLDFCAYKNGYHADAARTFLVGDVSEEKRRLVRVTEECFFKAVENLKAGTPLYDIGAAVQKHAESNGYSVVRALVGHGIGKEMHEDPAVTNFGKAGKGVRLKAGTVLCIEPMINMGGYQVDFLSDGWTVETRDKQPSAHYENTVVIREDGVEILTL